MVATQNNNDKPKKGKPKTPPAPQYTPTGGKMSGEEMRFSYWYVTHKVMLRRLGILALFALDLLLIVFVIYGLINYYIITAGETDRMHRAMTANALDYQ